MATAPTLWRLAPETKDDEIVVPQKGLVELKRQPRNRHGRLRDCDERLPSSVAVVGST